MTIDLVPRPLACRKKADGGKDLFGPQHPRCTNTIKRSDWPARCVTCHAVGGGGRCDKAIEDKKSLYCPLHAGLNSGGH